MMGKVQELSNPVSTTPLSEPFKIYSGKINSKVLKVKYEGQQKIGERQPTHHGFISCT